MGRLKICFFLALVWLVLGGGAPLRSQESADPADPHGLNALAEEPFSQLSDPGNSVLGKAALQVRAGEWKHAETPHFIFHFFHNFVAARVAAELEFYYHAAATEMHTDPAGWERKSHVYIFETPEDWKAFVAHAQLDPWTGGAHAEGNLYIQRNPAYKFQDRTLGHETAHLVLYRFFGPGVPLWLNEGYAENSSKRFYTGLMRTRGYIASQRSGAIPPADYIPVATLAAAASYPDDVIQVKVFYEESEKLVRFLRGQAGGDAAFVVFLDALSHGSRLETALDKAYGVRFSSVAALDREFAAYVSSPYALPGGG